MRRRSLPFLCLILTLLGLPSMGNAEFSRRCLQIKKVKRLAKRHNLSLKTLTQLESRYCKQARRTSRRPLMRGAIGVFRSDRCSPPMVAMIQANTDCSQLTSSRQAWAIQYKGKCINITDMSVQNACYLFGGDRVPVYHNDSCSGDPLAIVGAQSQCEELTVENKAWSIKLNGRCLNIPDMSLRMACHHFRLGRRERPSLEIYSNDSCTGHMNTVVGRHTSCKRLSSVRSAWAIKFHGRCLNISDTSPKAACYQYGGGHTVVYHNDSCSGKPVAIIGASSKCNQLTVARKAWSLKIRGKCINIPDMSVRNACYTYGGGQIPMYDNTTCQGEPAAIVGADTKCKKLDENKTIRSIRIRRRCIKILDASLDKACHRYRSQ